MWLLLGLALAGQMCQYVPRLGRPEGDWKDTLLTCKDPNLEFRKPSKELGSRSACPDRETQTWMGDAPMCDGHDGSAHLKACAKLSLPMCRAACDKHRDCAGFVRRVGAEKREYIVDELEMLRKMGETDEDGDRVFTEEEAQEMSMKQPDDFGEAECWLLSNKAPLRTKVIKLFKRLKMRTKRHSSSDAKYEKFTYEKRNCQCGYRYLGVPRQGSDHAPLPEGLKGCEGIFRWVGREFVPTVENVYQKIEVESVVGPDGDRIMESKVHFLYQCAKEQDGILRRKWYCASNGAIERWTERIQEKLEAVRPTGMFSGVAERSSVLRTLGRSSMRNMTWLNDCGEVPFGLEATLDVGAEAVTGIINEGVTRESDLADLTNHESIGFVETSTPLGMTHYLNSEDPPQPVQNRFIKERDDYPGRDSPVKMELWCADDNEIASKQQNAYQLKSADSCGADTHTQEHVEWTDRITTMLSVSSMATGLESKDQERFATVIGHAVQVHKLIEYITKGSQGTDEHGKPSGIFTPADKWEKVACAEKLIQEVKAAEGIFPKVAQNLADRPDIITDDYVRSILKETQTENTPKSNEELQEYLRQQDARIEFEEGVFVPLFPDLISELGNTLGTGSVGQVVKAKVARGPVGDKLRAALGDEVVMKFTFEENKKRYEGDWAIINLAQTLIGFFDQNLDPENDGYKAWVTRWVTHKAANFFKLVEAGEQIVVPASISKMAAMFAVLQQSVMEEFDLTIEHDYTIRGKIAAEQFMTEDREHRRLPGGVTVKVPGAMKSSSPFIMLQQLASGITLKSYMVNIEGNDKLVMSWREEIYKNIIDFYGYLVLKQGFWQADPHQGNWMYDEVKKILWLIDWGAVGDLDKAVEPGYQDKLKEFYREAQVGITERRTCAGVSVKMRQTGDGGRSLEQQYIQAGSTSDLKTRKPSNVFHGVGVGDRIVKPVHDILERHDTIGWVIKRIYPEAANPDDAFQIIARCFRTTSDPDVCPHRAAKPEECACSGYTLPRGDSQWFVDATQGFELPFEFGQPTRLHIPLRDLITTRKIPDEENVTEVVTGTNPNGAPAHFVQTTVTIEQNCVGDLGGGETVDSEGDFGSSGAVDSEGSFDSSSVSSTEYFSAKSSNEDALVEVKARVGRSEKPRRSSPAVVTTRRAERVELDVEQVGLEVAQDASQSVVRSVRRTGLYPMSATGLALEPPHHPAHLALLESSVEAVTSAHMGFPVARPIDSKFATIGEIAGFDVALKGRAEGDPNAENELLVVKALMANLLGTEIDTLVYLSSFLGTNEDPNAAVHIPVDAVMLIRAVNCFIGMIKEAMMANPPILVRKTVHDFIGWQIDTPFATWEKWL